ncbi:hypothetical protein B0O99DRAFT_147321 [Bisporella sp. PMI_857]|nr:hypothetical protein B0O99DRAFT_147321 [Bisporella sp. PMI_857]
MASYQSGSDPPIRTEDQRKTRRQGGYMAPTIRSQSRERGNMQVYGQTEARSGQTPVDRIYQTVPRPRIRDPSPSTKSVAGTKPKSGFGFGNATTTTTVTAGGSVPELKGKSSRNVLRRKPSSIAKQAAKDNTPPIPSMEKVVATSPAEWMRPSSARHPSTESSMRPADVYTDIFTRPSARVLKDEEVPRVIPELDRYGPRLEQPREYLNRNPGIPKLSTQNLPLATPLSSGGSSETPVYGLSSNTNRYSGYSGSGYSASPSTRFSESPGPGAYSRDTTPTSMSSQSPGIMAPLKINTPRLKQGSPAYSRPPVARRRGGSLSNEVEVPTVDTQGLPALRESLNSSSSNSTVKADGKTKEPEKERKKKGLSPLPPSPPPRKSSQKFKKERSIEDSPTKSKTSVESKRMPSSDLSLSKPPMASLQTQSPGQTVPPVRPSREGTPSLTQDSINVVQSNLTGLNFSHNRRRSSLPRGTSPLMSAQQPSKLLSRNPSPSPVMPTQREGTPAPAGLGIVPNLRPPQELHPALRPAGTRTPSPIVTNTKTRFALFGRRTKTAPEISTLDTKDKASRKGPAAGTGHEGYGKYATRGRSSSTGGTSRARDRSLSGAHSSQESIANTLSNDPFLRERMSPVVIAGGGEIIENRNASSELSRSESNTSLVVERRSLESKGSSRTNLSNESNRTTLWPSALPKDALPRDVRRTSTLAMPKTRRPSDSADEVVGKTSLAFRRSMQRMNNSTGALNLPKPIQIPGMGLSPSLNSLDSSVISNESQMERLAELNRGRKGHLTKPRKLEKRPKSPRKWNIFHRSQPAKEDVGTALPVQVGRPVVKAVPHYALLDSSDEQQDNEDVNLEDILRDADVVDLTNEELDALQFGAYKENLRRINDLNTMIETGVSLPERSPIIFSSPEPMQTPELQQGGSPIAQNTSPPRPAPLKVIKDPLIQPMDLKITAEIAPVRPSRLAQVGRIPKVISARPVATSPKSFSRPFARLSTIQPLQAPIVLDKESIAVGPSPPKPSTPEPHSDALPIGLGLRQQSIDSKSDAASTNHKDFLAFSPRKGSEATSSSGGNSYLDTVAVIPQPDAALVEDEVWDEYDDLMGNEGPVPVSATSSHGNPFEYESYESRRLGKSKVPITIAMDSPSLPSTAAPSSPSKRSVFTTSSVYSADMTQVLRDALAAEPTPTTPMSFTDFFSGYGDRNNSTPGDSARKPQRTSQGSRKSNGSSSHTRSASGLVTIPEQENNSSISQVNLRVGSMTVSKWLTFGHVLFSPAREELMQLEGSTKRHSILVIDGLGNGMFSSSFTIPSS